MSNLSLYADSNIVMYHFKTKVLVTRITYNLSHGHCAFRLSSLRCSQVRALELSLSVRASLLP